MPNGLADKHPPARDVPRDRTTLMDNQGHSAHDGGSKKKKKKSSLFGDILGGLGGD